MNEHVRIEEMIAARALGGLEPDEADELSRIMSTHGASCAECRRLTAAYEETAGRLAFAVGPDEIPVGMEDRLLGAISERPRRLERPRRRVASLVAAAAALLLVAGGVGGYLLAPRQTPGLSEAAAYVSQPGARVVPLQGSGRGNVALAYHPGLRVAYLIGSGLASLPRSKVYELWLMRGGNLQPGATFSAPDHVVVVRIPSDASDASLAAVTVERAPGAAHPTANPIFSARITV